MADMLIPRTRPTFSVSDMIALLRDRGDPLSLAASRALDRLSIEATVLDEEIVTLEFKTYAQAVEIERMRATFLNRPVTPRARLK